jgi:hypothetical protein
MAGQLKITYVASSTQPYQRHPPVRQAAQVASSHANSSSSSSALVASSHANSSSSSSSLQSTRRISRSAAREILSLSMGGGDESVGFEHFRVVVELNPFSIVQTTPCDDASMAQMFLEIFRFMGRQPHDSDNENTVALVVVEGTWIGTTETPPRFMVRYRTQESFACALRWNNKPTVDLLTAMGCHPLRNTAGSQRHQQHISIRLGRADRAVFVCGLLTLAACSEDSALLRFVRRESNDENVLEVPSNHKRTHADAQTMAYMEKEYRLSSVNILDQVLCLNFMSDSPPRFRETYIVEFHSGNRSADSIVDTLHCSERMAEVLLAPIRINVKALNYCLQEHLDAMPDDTQRRLQRELFHDLMHQESIHNFLRVDRLEEINHQEMRTYFGTREEFQKSVPSLKAMLTGAYGDRKLVDNYCRYRAGGFFGKRKRGGQLSGNHKKLRRDYRRLRGIINSKVYRLRAALFPSSTESDTVHENEKEEIDDGLDAERSQDHDDDDDYDYDYEDDEDDYEDEEEQEEESSDLYEQIGDDETDKTVYLNLPAERKSDDNRRKHSTTEETLEDSVGDSYHTPSNPKAPAKKALRARGHANEAATRGQPFTQEEKPPYQIATMLLVGDVNDPYIDFLQEGFVFDEDLLMRHMRQNNRLREGASGRRVGQGGNSGSDSDGSAGTATAEKNKARESARGGDHEQQAGNDDVPVVPGHDQLRVVVGSGEAYEYMASDIMENVGDERIQVGAEAEETNPQALADLPMDQPMNVVPIMNQPDGDAQRTATDLPNQNSQQEPLGSEDLTNSDIRQRSFAFIPTMEEMDVDVTERQTRGDDDATAEGSVHCPRLPADFGLPLGQSLSGLFGLWKGVSTADTAASAAVIMDNLLATIDAVADLLQHEYPEQWARIHQHPKLQTVAAG